MKLIKNKDQERQGGKRHYLPYTFKWNCKKCKKEIETDFASDYFSYPKLNVPIKHIVYCECECGHENEQEFGFIIKEILELIE